MQVHYSLDNLPLFRRAVVTIGTFDGVHTGHQKIIEALKEEALKTGGETIVITFQPHPRKIVTNDSLQLINTLEEKIELLAQYNIHHLVVVPFTNAFAEQPAEAYIEHFLVAKFHPHTVIIGYDHQFGKNRQGNFSLLQQYAEKLNYQLIEIPKQVLNEIAISSTKIRNALLDSDIETANTLLGYAYFFSGLVVAGDRIGRRLNYPTANLVYTDSDKICLGHGVYAVMVTVNGEEKGGMLSIGTRPTLHNSEEKIEVHIFDFNNDIYGQTIRVTVKKFLRHQVKFSNLDELTQQLDRDKEESLKWL
ncbi:MAG TPA: riboflavin biosynthesis protein RibF [Chitinophagaceae bacterium]|jgi:riboflavin kinase/FMN adenylyltransferase|nr:riboflavin biosynthesis protein RibF [Chitinophagaceae bacterium]